MTRHHHAKPRPKRMHARVRISGSCPTGKVCFATELDAKLALFDRQIGENGEERPYPCEFGKHFHLTSQEKRQSA